MRKPSLLLSLLLLWSRTHLALAGSVITTNLPSNVEIVNILGTADGASGNNGDLGEFSAPYASDPTLTLPPGTYQFFLVDPTDAATAFPSLTAAQLATIQTAWTFNGPWTTDYVVFDSLALTNPNVTQLFDGANGTYNEGTTYGSQQAAYDAARSRGYFDNIRVGDRTSLNFQKTYTLTTAETLVFAVPDYLLSDNAGGISVVVEAVPEPATTAMFVVACGVLGWAGWHQRQKSGGRSCPERKGPKISRQQKLGRLLIGLFLSSGRCLGAAVIMGVGWLPAVCGAQEIDSEPTYLASEHPWSPLGQQLLVVVLAIGGALLLMERLCAWRLRARQRRLSATPQLRDVLPSLSLYPSKSASQTPRPSR